MTLSRRRFFFGSLALPALAATKPVAEQPNILLILADRLPSWILGCYGNNEVRTPNLDRLAQTGMRFLNHFACAPASVPGRATLLTGRTPMQLGGADAGSPGDAPLSKVLEGRGYACAAADSALAGKSLDEQAAGKPFFLTVDCNTLRPPYDGVAQKYRDLYAQVKFATFSQEAAAKNAAADKEMLSDLAGNQRNIAAAVTALDDAGFATTLWLAPSSSWTLSDPRRSRWSIRITPNDGSCVCANSACCSPTRSGAAMVA